jgi:hypothetical protein
LVALHTVIHGARDRSARQSTAIPICHESEYMRFISTYCSQSTVFEHLFKEGAGRFQFILLQLEVTLQQVPEMVLRLADTYHT